MKVLSLQIDSWRHLREISLTPPEDSSLVALIGANGSGKSSILELLGGIAHRMGLSPGIDMARGDPLQTPHRLEATLRFPRRDVRISEGLQNQLDDYGVIWDGTIQFTSEMADRSDQILQIGVPELPEHLGLQLAGETINAFRQGSEMRHLFLDADRAYPPITLQPHHIQEIWVNDWESPQILRAQSIRQTKNLYEDWHKYFIAREERFSTDYVAQIRRARQSGDEAPPFLDPFDPYREALEQVLPHLRFMGVTGSGQARNISFDSTGEVIPFTNLSGGEREIAFLVGQIQRFSLRRGLLLVDEPELHLNPDLLRTWLSYLRDSVDDGQVWVATHSLEAVEVAGSQSSWVLERSGDSRVVSLASPLAGRPVLSALSAAVGSPAFSIRNLRFVFIEGDRQSRERERFFAVCGDPTVNRFIEGGSCSEVIRRVTLVGELASETDEQLRTAGVVDRDFRSAEEIGALLSSHLYVLECHEIENVFLQPEAINYLIGESGLQGLQALDMLREASDKFAGLWVSQRAAWTLRDSHDVSREILRPYGSTEFGGLSSQFHESVAAGVDQDFQNAWIDAAVAAEEEYRKVRLEDELWMVCLGKQVLPLIAKGVGLSGSESLERRVSKLWAAEVVPRSPALQSLIAFLATI